MTNWPVERALFPENLKLTVGWFSPGMFTVEWRHDLIDETTYLPPMTEPSMPYVEEPSGWIDSDTTGLLFNETYIYQKIPLAPYRILGFPAISIPINVTVDRAASLEVQFLAYLGMVSMAGDWFELTSLGSDTWLGGPYWMWYVQWPTNIIITNTAQNIQPIDITVEPYWRLAIRLLIYVHVNSPVSDNIAYVTVTLLYHSDSRELVVDIPIVRGP